MKSAILALIIRLGFSATAQAQSPPAACNSARQLPAELSANVGDDARCCDYGVPGAP